MPVIMGLCRKYMHNKGVMIIYARGERAGGRLWGAYIFQYIFLMGSDFCRHSTPGESYCFRSLLSLYHLVYGVINL